MSVDVEPQTRAVEVLTDEELSLLTYGPGAVVTPYFSELAAEDTELVQRTAYRSLVARGTVDSSGAPGDGPARLTLREDVMTLVSLRQAATTLVAVARTMIDQQDFWYAHVVEDLVVLEEVSVDGLHRFALGFTRDLPTLLLEVGHVVPHQRSSRTSRDARHHPGTAPRPRRPGDGHAMTWRGMDTESVQSLSSDLRDAGARVQELAARLEGRLADTEWIGEDATRFRPHPERRQRLRLPPGGRRQKLIM